MDNSKIFSKVHEAYKESFEILQIFGIFGTKDPTRMGKLWSVFIVLAVLLCPFIALLLSHSAIKNFGEFIEHTAFIVTYFSVLVQLINIRFRQSKFIEIATLFQELKKFDENDIVRKSEFFMERIMKIWLVSEFIFGTFYSFHQHIFNETLVFYKLFQFYADSHLSTLIGIVDWLVVMCWMIIYINSQKITFMTYTQSAAHLKCLIVKLSKIKKPENVEDSKENLEKLHEIIEIHQKLKWYEI
jgi:hypothetical protein